MKTTKTGLQEYLTNWCNTLRFESKWGHGAIYSPTMLKEQSEVLDIALQMLEQTDIGPVRIYISRRVK
jgi:hypothetical protein